MTAVRMHIFVIAPVLMTVGFALSVYALITFYDIATADYWRGPAAMLIGACAIGAAYILLRIEGRRNARVH